MLGYLAQIIPGSRLPRSGRWRNKLFKFFQERLVEGCQVERACLLRQIPPERLVLQRNWGAGGGNRHEVQPQLRGLVVQHTQNHTNITASQVKLFVEFASQRLGECFTGTHLAAGEFPEPAMGLVGGALRQQITPTALNDRSNYIKWST